MKWLLLIVLIWNIITCLLMGIDKSKAVRDRRRISERTLLTCSFLFGGIGALLGAILWHHKTRKLKFQICLPLAFLITLGVVYLMIAYMLS